MCEKLRFSEAGFNQSNNRVLDTFFAKQTLFKRDGKVSNLSACRVKKYVFCTCEE